MRACTGAVTTWGAYYTLTRQFAKALLALGLPRFATVGIMGFNSPEWSVACLGAITAGCVSAGVYATNGPETCQHIAAAARLQVVCCETLEQCRLFLNRRAALPHLRTVVCWGQPCQGEPGVTSWQEFMASGQHIDSRTLDARVAEQRPEHCCTLIFTSGTTGSPKGVMISHDNVTWTASTVLDVFAASVHERMVSFLPLSHVAAAMLDVYGPAIVGFCVYFADTDALKGSLVNTLRAVRPTVFFGVPRVYEKIMDRMLEFGRSKPVCVRWVSAWAKSIGSRACAADECRQARPWGFAAADFVVFRRVRAALGLDQCRALFSGAAPMQPHVLRYFRSLHMQVHELYGMSECTGPHSANLPSAFSTGTCGRPLPGMQMRLHNPDAAGVGEVCIRGRHV